MVTKGQLSKVGFFLTRQFYFYRCSPELSHVFPILSTDSFLIGLNVYYLARRLFHWHGILIPFPIFLLPDTSVAFVSLHYFL